MPINFGVMPVRCSFSLSSDADFFQTVRTADGSNFVGTAVVSIVWENAAGTVVDTWTATLDDDTATFEEDKADVAALLLLLPVQGRVFYEDGAGGPELLMAKGPIINESN